MVLQLSIAIIKISVIPDFISNCGMARAFDYFMSGKKKSRMIPYLKIVLS